MEEGIKPYFKLVSSFTQGLSGIFIFFVILVWPKREVFMILAQNAKLIGGGGVLKTIMFL